MAHVHRFDVVIVGAGGAGLRAALEVPREYSCAVLTKVFASRSHTGTAQGGVCAALSNEEEDKPIWHVYDTVKGSDYLGDQDAIEIMCEDAPRAIIELEHMGLPFSRTPAGKIAQRRFGGHTRDYGDSPVRRACYSADRTGLVMQHTLFENCLKQHVNFFHEYHLTDLIVRDGKAVGLVAINMLDQELHVFHAKAILIATGGFGRAYRITSNAHAGTGDGMWLAWQAGIPLEDMEFVQFHPTGLWKLGILVSEAARGEGGILRNKDGEAFMERYAPSVKDLAPRDMVSRSIVTEIREGRGIHAPDGTQYVHLDLTHLGEDVINHKLPEITGFARTYLGVEPLREPIPVTPTCHYAMGGIPTNADAEVLANADGDIIEGLYSAGETACVSVHGANRLGTNSLLDIIVFGRRGGKAIAKYLNSGADYAPIPVGVEERTRDRIEQLIRGNGNESVPKLRAELQELMTKNVGEFRNDADLKVAIEKLNELKQRCLRTKVHDDSPVFNTELTEAFELDSLVNIADAIARSALNRTESRGAHSREDYPERRDDEWLKHTMIHRSESGETQFSYKDVNLKLWKDDGDAEHFKPKPRTY